MSKGRILLVSLGPGAEAQMSLRARGAIAESEVVIGYASYLKLIEGLLAGKRVIASGMTQEIDRCAEAYREARRGKTVALVSSGDVGVYGMAGPAYEFLLRSGWTPGRDVTVEVVPGITALSACASLVGAPLTHDFCSVSLSDLLTPWPVIARRLEHAARGDFVIALYNPRSGRRRGQLREAQRILLCHRPPETPVAAVKSAYREGQDARLTTLGSMLRGEIGMSSTMLIGNSGTFRREGLMVTPRGYADKYEVFSGVARAGERPGRSLAMGLEGWKARVRETLRRPDAPGVRELARRFAVPLGEILSAIDEGSGEDPAGGCAARAVIAGHEDQLLEAATGWGQVRVSMEGKGAARAELCADPLRFLRRGDRMTLQETGCRLELDWAEVGHAWFLSRGDEFHGVFFLDAAGDGILQLSLARSTGGFDPQALARFRQAWSRLGGPARRSEDR